VGPNDAPARSFVVWAVWYGGRTRARDRAGARARHRFGCVHDLLMKRRNGAHSASGWAGEHEQGTEQGQGLETRPLPATTYNDERERGTEQGQGIETLPRLEPLVFFFLSFYFSIIVLMIVYR
jgi:hypothetical protein